MNQKKTSMDDVLSFDLCENANRRFVIACFRMFDAFEFMRTTNDFEEFKKNYDILLDQFSFLSTDKNLFAKLSERVIQFYRDCHPDALALDEDLELVSDFDIRKLNEGCILLANACSERFVALHREEIHRFEMGNSVAYHKDQISKEGKLINDFVDRLHDMVNLDK